MGVFHPYDVICPNCDHHYSVNLANTVNVTRFPDLKRQVLARELHNGRCGTCGYVAPVEKPFLYVDMDNGLNVSVYPRKERHFHVKASAETELLSAGIKSLKTLQPRTQRVAFGLEELREKVVAADAGLDDRLVETLKLYVIKEHPFLIQKRRLRISLDAVSAQKLDFQCTFDHEASAFRVSVPRAFYEAIPQEAAGPARPTTAVRMLSPAEGTAAQWVNLWKLNPSNDALAQLSAYAEAIRRNESVDLSSLEFAKMLRTLPRGNQLAGWAKRDLQTLADYAREEGNTGVEDDLFEVRFGFELDDDWFKNSDHNDVKTIWRLLKDLPDIAVEGNSWIRVINLDLKSAGGGYYYSAKGEISIGSGMQSNTLPFRNVVLHEVGHATQELLDRDKKQLVTKWLAERFGWQSFGIDSAGIDAWIGAIGGYPNGTGTLLKNQIRSCIQQSIGPGSTFEAASIASAPTNHLWNDHAFGPRSAFEKTGRHWWSRCDQWHLAAGKRFFVNYYYSRLMAIDDTAVSLIVEHMPNRYASMSPYEFFAEIFAWYYDGQSPRRDKIPAAISAWLVANIGSLDPSSPFAPPKAAPTPSAAPAGRRVRRTAKGRGRKRA